jgi:hypothetical protein
MVKRVVTSIITLAVLMGSVVACSGSDSEVAELREKIADLEEELEKQQVAPTPTPKPEKPLYELSGFTWDPCSQLISIHYMNDSGRLYDNTFVSDLKSELIQIAQEVSTYTGFDIRYMGEIDYDTSLLNQDTVTRSHRDKYDIVVVSKIDERYTDGSYINSLSWYQRASGYKIIDLTQLNLSAASEQKFRPSLHGDFLRQTIGAALGLEVLLGPAGKNEIMHGNDNASTWGEGDKLGLQAVGASNNCD